MKNTIPQMMMENAEKYPEILVQIYRNKEGKLENKTYSTFFKEIQAVASTLKSMDVKKEEPIGLISENRKEWLVFDMAVQSLRAADVPRGCDSTDQELTYILGVTEARICAVEREKELKRVLGIKKDLPKLKTIVVLDAEFKPEKEKEKGVQIIPFLKLIEDGKKLLEKEPEAIKDIIKKGEGDDLSTIIFTSGTTGKPKGVMLQQKAFTNQILQSPKRLVVNPGEVWLAILPVWHSYERALNYIAVGLASTIAYSKPIGSIILADFKEIEPTYLPSVPRIWEAVRASIYRKVNAAGGISKIMFNFFVAVGSFHAYLGNMVKGRLPRFKNRSRVLDFFLAFGLWLFLWPLRLLGKVLVFKKITNLFGRNFRAGISGGGALQPEIDKFYQAAGVCLAEGYGLTESGPIIGVRTFWAPEIGTVGPPFPGMEIKIVDEEGNKVPWGTKGEILARGPQIMKGYYKDEEATKAVINEDGWLKTGDLGMMTKDGTYKIVGRAKDTVVLLGGENIEPLPIEQRMKLSPYIDQAVVQGQDKKFLGALITPNFEMIEEYAKEHKISYSSKEELATSKEITDLIREEISEEISEKNGFKPFEKIYRFKVLPVTFEVNRELSAKQEFKRHVIADLYKKEIEELFK